MTPSATLEPPRAQHHPHIEQPALERAPQLSIVIPAYNESARLPRTLDAILAWLQTRSESWEILVSDDGSTDGTPELVERTYPRCRVVRAPHNMGKGAAVRRGMLAARGDFRLFSDADLSTPIDELGPMLDRMRRDEFDIVIGSRALPESRLVVRQPWWREFSGRFFNSIVRPISGLPFHDTQCGFKLFRAAAAQACFARQRSDGWAFDVEVLMIAQFLGFQMLEYPVRWENSDASKITMWRDAPRMLRDILVFRWRRLNGGMTEPVGMD